MSPSASRRSCAAGRPAAVEPASVFSFSSRRTPSLARSSRTKLFWASAAVAQRRAAATAAARAKVLSIWCSSWAFRPWVSAAGRACDAAAHGQERAYHSAPAPQTGRDSIRRGRSVTVPGGGSGHENDATGIGGGALRRGGALGRGGDRPRRFGPGAKTGAGGGTDRRRLRGRAVSLRGPAGSGAQGDP